MSAVNKTTKTFNSVRSKCLSHKIKSESLQTRNAFFKIIYCVRSIMITLSGMHFVVYDQCLSFDLRFDHFM